jgi:hypothetical protein
VGVLYSTARARVDKNATCARGTADAVLDIDSPDPKLARAQSSHDVVPSQLQITTDVFGDWYVEYRHGILSRRCVSARTSAAATQAAARS